MNRKDKKTQAYAFVLGYFREDEDRPCSYKYLISKIGDVRTKTYKDLIELLVCTDDFYSKDAGICKKYRLVPSITPLRANKIKALMAEHNEAPDSEDYAPGQLRTFEKRIVTEFWRREYKEELRTGIFSYNLKSNRYWHSLQNIKTEAREALFEAEGYKHNYDISACALTTLLQTAKSLDPSQEYPNLEEYLGNKDYIRNNLAEHYNVPVKKIKVLFNSLLSGAKLVASERFELFHLFNRNYGLVQALGADEYVKAYKSEVSRLWAVIGHKDTGRIKRRYKQVTNQDTGEITNRLIPLSSREKWNLYFFLECKVMDSATQYCKAKSIKMFREHDGFRSTQAIDTKELSHFVVQSCGLSVEFEGGEKVAKPITHPSIAYVQQNEFEGAKIVKVEPLASCFSALEPDRGSKKLHESRYNSSSLMIKGLTWCTTRVNEVSEIPGTD